MRPERSAREEVSPRDAMHFSSRGQPGRDDPEKPAGDARSEAQPTPPLACQGMVTIV